MNKNDLNFLVDVLTNSTFGLSQSVQNAEEVGDDNFKRAINVHLEAIKANVANIQHLIES